MEIEDKIRSRIEAILTNDAKNYAEIKRMAADDEPFETEPFAEERNLYQRIINNYRNAIREVNALLEENVGFLSCFYRIIETIKDKNDFQAICTQVVGSILQELGAEYCSLTFTEANPQAPGSFCLEGVREDRKFFRIHSDPDLLGSPEFEEALVRLTADPGECIHIGDVYREPSLNNVDFPSVVRSFLCLPLVLQGKSIGRLILSHSLPRYFKDNHLRVLKILASTVAHIRLLTGACNPGADWALSPQPGADIPGEKDVFSVILLDFKNVDASGRKLHLDKESIRGLRRRIASGLESRGPVLFHDELELLILLPGVSSDLLPGHIRVLQEIYRQWRADQGERLRGMSMSVGFSTGNADEDLSRTLELAAFAMHRDLDDRLGLAAAGS